MAPTSSVTFSDASGRQETKRTAVDEQNHLESLGKAILDMQMQMNEYLTKIMQEESNSQVIEKQSDEIDQEEI